MEVELQCNDLFSFFRWDNKKNEEQRKTYTRSAREHNLAICSIYMIRMLLLLAVINPEVPILADFTCVK